MAIVNTINLAPASAENTTYEASGSVSTRDFKIVRQKTIANATLGTELTVAVDGLAISVGSYEQGILVGAHYNFNGTGMTITNGDLTIKNNAGTSVFRSDTNGNLIITGNITATSGTFTGTVYASAGSFTGAVYASSGSFTGAVYASSGTFTGTINTSNITATGGTIGGWSIGTNITRNGITLGADYISLNNTGTTGSTINLGTAKIYNYGNSVGISGTLHTGTTYIGGTLYANVSSSSNQMVLYDYITDTSYRIGVASNGTFLVLRAYAI